MNCFAATNPFDLDAVQADFQRHLEENYEADRKRVGKELDEIDLALLDVGLYPNLKEYAELCTRLKDLIDSTLVFTADEMKKLLQTFEFSFIAYEMNGLAFPENQCPQSAQSNLPSDHDFRKFLTDLIDDQLVYHEEFSDMNLGLSRLKFRIQNPEHLLTDIKPLSDLEIDVNSLKGFPEEEFLAYRENMKNFYDEACHAYANNLSPPSIPAFFPPSPAAKSTSPRSFEFNGGPPPKPTATTNPAISISNRKPRPLGPSASLPLLPSMANSPIPLPLYPMPRKIAQIPKLRKPSALGKVVEHYDH